jgi:TPR repeat protein
MANTNKKQSNEQTEPMENVQALLLAAQKGDAEAQFELGRAYYEGEGVAQDYKQAVKWWKKAAEQGLALAQNSLGQAYHDGLGVKQSDIQAIEWWKKAAKQGLPEAGLHLFANKFDQGFGPQKQAIKWWLKATKQELITAQCYLALAYKKGDGVKKDEKNSLSWLQKAAANTVLETKIEPDLNQAKEEHLIIFLSEEAKEGIAPAQVVLAHFYQMGTEQDRQQAFSWMEKAAQQQDLIAQYHLGVMYMEGQGVAANLEKASEQFQQIVGGIKNLFTHFTDHKKSHSFSKDKTDYSRDIKQWVGLLAQEKLGAINKEIEIEIEAKKRLLEQEKAAKQELEDVMAMFAHKFRGPLQSIRYNAEHSNHKKITIQAVQTMAGLLKIFSTIATDAQQLRLKLQQDMQGEGTILSVLEKALLPVIQQVLTIDNAKKIRQHYLGYAKKTGQVPATITRKQWVEDYFQLEEQLQAAWEESFSALLEAPRLDKIVAWIEERFFPLEVTGFNNDAIHFERYGATESTLIIVLTEMLLNAVKYYSSKTGEPVRLDWKTGTEFAYIVCENPSSRDERSIDKGSKKGHKFLNTIARNLQGDFPEPLPKNPYRVEWQIPMDLLMRNEQ